MTLARSKVKVKVTGLLNFRQLAKPCMLAAMTAAPLQGLSGFVCTLCTTDIINNYGSISNRNGKMKHEAAVLSEW